MAVGTLAPGSRLPTVRSLAADLGIAANVARAYKELEAGGLVEARRRGVTVVTGSSPGSPVARGTIPEAVTAAVERYIEAGRQAQLSDDVLLDLLRARLRKA